MTFMSVGKKEEDVNRSEVIDKLQRLEVDEMCHGKRVETMLLQMNIEPKKKDS